MAFEDADFRGNWTSGPNDQSPRKLATSFRSHVPLINSFLQLLLNTPWWHRGGTGAYSGKVCVG